MLRAFPRPTFLAKRAAKNQQQQHDNHSLGSTGSKRSLLQANPTVQEGPVLPSLGYATRGGEKHDVSEDRVFTSTLAAALGSSFDDMSFSDALTAEPDELAPEEVLVAAIFDGHGGTSCADFVAENLCNRISKALNPEKRRFEHLEAAIFDGFKACDDDFMEKAQANGDNSGCCALISFIYQNRIILGWSGDCRAVFWDGTTATQLTTDHRPNEPSENKRIIELGGKITNSRINGVLSPSRCFGDLDIRTNSPEGVLISEPCVVDVNNLKDSALRNRTSFMILATDGVWDVMSNEVACEIVARSLKASGQNPEAASLRLVDEASRLTSDDVSVIVITWSVVPWDVYSGISRESYLSDEGEKQ